MISDTVLAGLFLDLLLSSEWKSSTHGSTLQKKKKKKKQCSTNIDENCMSAENENSDADKAENRFYNLPL